MNARITRRFLLILLAPLLAAQLWTGHSGAASWSSWAALGGSPPVATPGSPASAAYQGHLYLFTVGSKDAIYYAECATAPCNASSSWSAWQGLGGTTYSNLAAAAYSTCPPGNACTAQSFKLFVFAVFPDNQVRQDVYNGSSWSGWTVLPGLNQATITPSSGWLTIAAVSPRASELDLYVAGRNGQIYQAVWSSNGPWQGWQVPLWTDTIAPPTVAVLNGQTHLFAVGTDSQVYEAVYNGYGWTGWTARGISAAAGDPPGAATSCGGQLDLFVDRYQDNQIYESTGNGTSWTGWSQLTRFPSSTYTSIASACYNNQPYVFATALSGLTGNIYVTGLGSTAPIPTPTPWP